MTSLTRSITAFLVLTAAATGSASAGLPTALDGSWYNPLQSGHGLTLERIDHDSALLFWHVFDPAGRPLTLYIQTEIDGNTMRGEVLAPRGMRFGRFEESELTLPFWGRVELSFSDCTHATLRYDSSLPGYGQGEIALTRLLGVKDNCSLEAPQGLTPLAGQSASATFGGEYGTGPEAALMRNPYYHGETAGFVTQQGELLMMSNDGEFGPTSDAVVFIGEPLPSSTGEAKLQVRVHANGWLNATMGVGEDGVSPASRADRFPLTLQTRRSRAAGLLLPERSGPGAPNGHVWVGPGGTGEGTLKPGVYPFLAQVVGSLRSGAFQLEVAADLSLCVRRQTEVDVAPHACAFTGQAGNGTSNFEFVLTPTGTAGGASFAGAGQARYCERQPFCDFSLRMIGDNGQTGLALYTRTRPR